MRIRSGPVLLGSLLMLVVAGPALATSGVANTWRSIYGSSGSEANAGCQLCHATSGGDNFNTYGWAITQELGAGSTRADAIQAVAGFDSDSDPTGSDNLTEISASTQPGWTSGPNTVFDDAGNTSTVDAPTTIGQLDPGSPEPDIDLTPTSVAFGDVQVGTSEALVVTVGNLGGADLQIDVIELCAGTGSDFSWSPATPFMVSASGSVSLMVTYQPSSSGPESGCLSIGSNDPDEPTISLAVSGNGVDPPPPGTPDIDRSPASLDFGDVAVDQTSTLAVEVANLGSAPLLGVLSRRCFGTSPEFTFEPQTPFTVDPGGVGTIEVSYSPSDIGPDDGCLEIDSNDPDEGTVEVGFSGNGVEPPVGALDLDIKKFKVRKKVKPGGGIPISPKLKVLNVGVVGGEALAAVVGVQGGVEVYSESLLVTDEVGGGSSKYRFPPYLPTSPGDIQWMAAIEDEDPDVDEAFATTRVIDNDGDSDGDSDADSDEDSDSGG